MYYDNHQLRISYHDNGLSHYRNYCTSLVYVYTNMLYIYVQYSTYIYTIMCVQALKNLQHSHVLLQKKVTEFEDCMSQSSSQR